MVTGMPRSATDEAADLGRLIGDPLRLLPGEDPATTDPDEAIGWLAAHRQLLTVRLELLNHLRTELAQVENPQVARGLGLNLEGLELSVRRSRSRVADWEARLSKLGAQLAAVSRP